MLAIAAGPLLVSAMRPSTLTRFLLLSAVSGSLQAASTAPAAPVDAPAAPAAAPAASAGTAAALPASLPTEVTGPAKVAMDEYQAGHHAKAIELAKPLADQGNADALYLLGFASESGQGVDQSKEKALE